MIVAATIAAACLIHLPGLIVCIVALGFFTGFYIVPLFTLLQHRAPKTSKGDWVATSNFLNVAGAILALGLFYLMSQGAILTGLAPRLETKDVATGALGPVTGERDRPEWVEVGGTRLPPEGQAGVVDPVRTSLRPTHSSARSKRSAGKPPHTASTRATSVHSTHSSLRPAKPCKAGDASASTAS